MFINKCPIKESFVYFKKKKKTLPMRGIEPQTYGIAAQDLTTEPNCSDVQMIV